MGRAWAAKLTLHSRNQYNPISVRASARVQRCRAAAPSFNGRTADSGSAYRGSNPWGAAKLGSITHFFGLPAKRPEVTVSGNFGFAHTLEHRCTTLRKSLANASGRGTDVPPYPNIRSESVGDSSYGRRKLVHDQ